MAVPDFGKPYAADGETRPSRFRTPLAWVAGYDGGVLLVQTGREVNDRAWLLMSEWEEWVSAVKASEAAPPALRDEPFEEPEPVDRH